MTLSDISILVSKLVASLQSGGPSASERDLAEEYAEACVRINERLAQCARMIDEGSSVQALMLAEEKPNLLEAVAALSFAQSGEWHESCALSALRPAPKIDRSSVHKVNELYDKGNKTEQTKALYKQFRAAMAARDDAAALDTIRTIASLDPVDLDAGKELSRLERKRREDLLKALSTELAGGNDDQVLLLLDQAQKLGMSEGPELARATAVQQRVLAVTARKEISDIIPLLAEFQNQGRWQQCGERATRVNSLTATYKLELSPQETSSVATARSYFESCRQEAMQKAGFKEALSALSECADRTQGGATSSLKNTLDGVEQQRLQLRKLYEKAKEFMLPIPENLISRVAQVAADLDGEIGRLRRSRKMRNVSLASGLALLLVALVAGGYFVLRAGQFATELRTLAAEDKALPLRQLVSEIQEQHSVYLNVPSLKSAILEANAWLDAVTAQTAAAESALSRAQSIADEEFSNNTPEEAAAIFVQANKALDQLPRDVADIKRPQLVESENKLTIWLAAMRDERVVDAKAKVQQARGYAEAIDAAGSGDELREALAPLTSAVGELLDATDTPVEQMRLPDGTKADIASLVTKQEQAADVLDAYDAAMARLSEAASAEEYAAAIQGLSQVQLPRSAVVKASQLLATKKLDAHQFLGSMLIPDSPDVWIAVKEAKDLATVPQPERTRDSEVDRLRDLLNNENIVGVHEAVLQDRDGLPTAVSGRKIFIRGRIDVSQPTQGVTRASGTIYDPALSGGKLNFQPQTFTYSFSAATNTQSGQRVDGQKESEASKAMQRFGLESLVNADGSKYRQSVLAVMDKVASARSAPPLVRAYVLLELASIAKARPNEWGLAWVPAFGVYLEEMKRLAGGTVESGDWMVPAKTQKSQALGDWFRKHEGFSFVAQQTLNRQLAKAALEAGLVVCGYIAADGSLVETQKDAVANATELWALGSESGVPFVAFVRANRAKEAPLQRTAAALPLSPVFCLPFNPADAVNAAFKSAQVPEDAASLYFPGLPRLFAARATEPTEKPNEQ